MNRNYFYEELSEKEMKVVNGGSFEEFMFFFSSNFHIHVIQPAPGTCSCVPLDSITNTSLERY
ncbi:MAG: bacteriocin [Bacteroides sp.]|nr:bacteriocin [Bacteroides sp.]